MKITLISTASKPIEQGMRIISTILKKEGHEVNIIFMRTNEDYYELYKKKGLKQLKNLCKKSQLIGISCVALSSLKTIQIIKYLKDNLNIPMVFGGIHATLSPESCIKYCNIVCIGEGEGAMLDLVTAMEKKNSFEKIKNLWIKKGNKIIKNEVRDLVDNLDELPFPDYEIKDHYIYDKGKIRKFKGRDLNEKIIFLSGRGCPYSCTYCSNGKFNELYKNHRKKIVRTNSINYTIKFLKSVKNKFKLKYVFMDDDSFTVRSVEDIKEFAKKYKKEINLPYKCTVDARSITEDKIKELVNSGCCHITLGIQGSERVNKEIYKRNIDNKDIIKTAKILNKYKDKCAVNYDLLINNPYENNQDFLDVFKLIKEIPKPFRLQINNLVFFTGSQLYKIGVENGTIKTLKDSKIDLNCDDRGHHILRTKKNIYLNTILALTRGVVSDEKYGKLKTKTLNKLLQKKYIKFFNDKRKITLIFPYSLIVFDFIKYKLIIRVYRKLPFEFKKWCVNKFFGKRILITDEIIR